MRERIIYDGCIITVDKDSSDKEWSLNYGLTYDSNDRETINRVIFDDIEQNANLYGRKVLGPYNHVDVYLSERFVSMYRVAR